MIIYADKVPIKNTVWIPIGKTSCIEQGGKTDRDGLCRASWDDALKICDVLGGKLPSLRELKSIVTTCGGKVGDYANAYCSKYKKNYKDKGFSDTTYWTHTEYVKMKNFAWVVYFYNGTKAYFSKNRNYAISCTKVKNLK